MGTCQGNRLLCEPTVETRLLYAKCKRGQKGKDLKLNWLFSKIEKLRECSFSIWIPEKHKKLVLL